MRRWVTFVGELLVGVGIEVREGKVFELGLDLRDAEPVGERRVDVEGLLGDALLLVRRKGLEGAHIVQAGRQA